MDFFNVINARHCCRGEFKDKPVSQEDLRKIVDAGLQAPSGKNAQTTTFIIVDDSDILSDISVINPVPVLKTAKALIACIIDKNPEPIFHNMNFVIEDCSAAVENMFLAITALGLGTVWLDGALRLEGRNEAIDKALKLPPTKTTRVILPVGFPKENGQSPKKLPFERRVFFNEYQKS